MVRWMLVTICSSLLLATAEDRPQPESQPATSQPATRPADARTTLRKPAQAEILRNLLEQQDRPTPIQPDAPAQREASAGIGPDGQPLLIEGTSLIERPGRLMREGGRSKFAFHAEGDTEAPRTMEILESQLLETMEREAEAGFSEFIISGKVTRYRGQNYLLLWKVLRRTSHGNVGP